ncbi:MAG TPA: 5-formyltetrahydrofolate cyclo-ligase [Tabrizicola sp.]|nr:5-formyltetrahydrofolate cyclo-ligase [Tabrizicola sp.]
MKRTECTSPPCLAEGFDPLDRDPEEVRDVARWRKAERMRLRAERDGLSVAERQAAGTAISTVLSRYLADRFGDLRGRVLSGYWPIKGEPDLRQVLEALHRVGARIALPVVVVKQAPLVFRSWTPATKMVRGDWNIPVPPEDSEPLVPEIALAPVMGWTREGYRLGYGGGYFDRTLAALEPRPFTIGIGFQSARLDTIFPQPHDIRLDVILTEAGVAST